jgi:hypothetical protein
MWVQGRKDLHGVHIGIHLLDDVRLTHLQR